MTRVKTWTLTDVRSDLWIDSFAVGNDAVRLPVPQDWSIRKRTLRGGLRDGVDLVEIHNGALAISILPTRGMGLWRGDYRGMGLGWRAPVQGPVHPKYVNESAHGGIGWLAGFDELLTRCGLSFNGPPGEDSWTDARGNHRANLSLHGRIANLPADVVEVKIGLDPPYELSVTGEVEEGGLFLGQLRLTTTYTTAPGSNRLVIHDVVENRSARPAEMQLLYHFNLGRPFLDAGSRILVPIKEMAPLTPRAAEGIDTYERYLGPTVGYSEQVYAYEPQAPENGHTLALLVAPNADSAVAVRFKPVELPCFTVWKNTAALEDGYVTGLEPATGFPNFRNFERQQGRVKVLPPGGKWEARWAIEIADNAKSVASLMAEVATLQALGKAIVHRTPQPKFSPLP